MSLKLEAGQSVEFTFPDGDSSLKITVSMNGGLFLETFTKGQAEGGNSSITQQLDQILFYSQKDDNNYAQLSFGNGELKFTKSVNGIITETEY